MMKNERKRDKNQNTDHGGGTQIRLISADKKIKVRKR